MINLNGSFVLFANCEVVYDGRAYSTLELGNYLIIHKGDGSLQIHGNSKIQPRNYQGAKSTLVQRGNLLISKCRGEIITIIIHKVIDYTPLRYWSESEIEISRTEHELVLKLFMDWPDYFDATCHSIEMEVETTYGKVDLLGTEFDGMKHVIEVKRRKASVPDVTQLKRYVECFEKAVGYLAAPDIGEKALKYLGECGFSYIEVNF
jgi:RecB family endonuclease NucS